MPGSYDPVLTVEQLWLDKGGRGLYVHADGIVADITQTSKGSLPWVSGVLIPSSQVLPVPSTMGWLKITWMSGSVGSVANGWMPIFSGNVVGI